MLFLVKCPKCAQQMKYDSRDPIISNKNKRCVFCNKFFRVGKNIIKKL